ncbi:serine/threonine protein kinase, partial [bacterium]|nr:serine/threonine protein kinase [bacterium]
MSNRVCNPKFLQEALVNDFCDLSDEHLKSLESHLSACDDCRQQMESFAGEPNFWKLTTDSLSGSDINASFDGGPSSVTVRVDHLADSGAAEPFSTTSFESRSLLDAPTHPEMLGRIDGFSVEQLIGRGGMGVVFKGYDGELNRPVAIKFLSPHLAASGVARQRFAREAQAAAAVMHPNVVPIHSVNSSPVRPYIVMAFVSGRSLQKHVVGQGSLGVKDIVRIGQQIAAGLAAAHQQGLVHRDIKPANVLLEHDVSRVMITDFGLARAADDAALTQTGWLAGTPHYMSPEQANGDEIDGRSDLFSLGSVMYFMATGREPFRAERSLAVLKKITSAKPTSLRSINSSVPKTLEDVVEKLLAKDVEDRFKSASEVQEVLTEYLAYLQDPKSNRKPVVNKSKINRKRLAWLVPIVMLFAIPLGLGFRLGVSHAFAYITTPAKKPRPAVVYQSNNRASNNAYEDYGGFETNPVASFGGNVGAS